MVHLPLASQLHQWIRPQGLMIIEILLAQGDGEDALAKHADLAVGDQTLVAGIGNGCIHTLDEAEPPFDLAQQEHTAVAGDRTAVEISDDLASAQTGKADGGSVTLCHVALPPCSDGCLLQLPTLQEVRPFSDCPTEKPREISGLKGFSRTTGGLESPAGTADKSPGRKSWVQSPHHIMLLCSSF